MERSMLTLFGLSNKRLIDPALLLARALLAAIFVHEGFTLAVNFDSTLMIMSKLGVPAPMAAATIALQLLAGLALVAGWQARSAAFALGLFCLATATLFHTNFANHNELLHFEKDLAIAGGMFGFAARGAGGWALDRILRDRPARIGRIELAQQQ
jgi:putative oxidoreductase